MLLLFVTERTHIQCFGRTCCGVQLSEEGQPELITPSWWKAASEVVPVVLSPGIHAFAVGVH